MSARSRDLPRRSCLSTPGSNEKFLAKAPTVAADMTFLDLEDAVAPLEKEGARAKVVDAIKNLPWDDRVLCVRVNAWDTEWTYGDVIEVVGNAGERLDEVMLPKVQSAAEVVALDLLFTQVEKKSGCPSGHIGIEAQIETARGLINVDEICAASPRLETIIFGPADFAAIDGDARAHRRRRDPRVPRRPLPLRLQPDPDGRPGQRPAGDRRPVPERARARRAPRVLHADAHARLRRQVGAHARPGAVLNEVYSPTQEQFDRAFDILDAYRKATEEDRKGAVMFGDEMIDEASRKMAIKFVSRGERAGLRRADPRSEPRSAGASAHQTAGDDLERERLVGALEDREHPGVDEVAAHGELLGVAHAAVDLHGLPGHPLGGPADVGLDHGGLERALALGHEAAPRGRSTAGWPAMSTAIRPSLAWVSWYSPMGAPKTLRSAA